MSYSCCSAFSVTSYFLEKSVQ